MYNTFSITFYCRKSRVNSKGTAPIEVRVTNNGKVVMTSLPKRAFPEDFVKQMSSKKQNSLKSYTSVIADKIENLQVKLLMEGKSFTNETEQTVRVFYKPNQVIEQRRGIPEDSFRQSTGISYLKDTEMVLSLTDFYRFPKVFLLSGYDGDSTIEVKPQYGYVVVGKSPQSFPEGVYFVNVSLPIGNELLEYYDNSGERLDAHSITKESLESRMAIDQEVGSYAPNRGFFSLPDSHRLRRLRNCPWCRRRWLWLGSRRPAG